MKRLVPLVLAVALAAGCSNASVGTTTDGASSPCTAYAPGNVCQSASVCSAGYINMLDLPCNATGQLCCAPAPE